MKFTSLLVTLLFVTAAHGADIDKLLEESNQVLKNPQGDVSNSQLQKSGKSDGTRSSRKKTSAPHLDEDKLSDGQNVTNPPSGKEASDILNIDLKALAKEREPQDPRFTAYFMGGALTASPSSAFNMTKDDDTFVLNEQSTFGGGSIDLVTSWKLHDYSEGASTLRILFSGGAGLYSGRAGISRTGVQNQNGDYDYYIAPIRLMAGLSYELNHKYNFSLRYGPLLEIASQRGNAITDTLTNTFSGDQLDLGIGATIKKGWEIQGDFMQTGVLNQNLKGQGIIVGLGYRISG